MTKNHGSFTETFGSWSKTSRIRAPDKTTDKDSQTSFQMAQKRHFIFFSSFVIRDLPIERSSRWLGWKSIALIDFWHETVDGCEILHQLMDCLSHYFVWVSTILLVVQEFAQPSTVWSSSGYIYMIWTYCRVIWTWYDYDTNMISSWCIMPKI